MQQQQQQREGDIIRTVTGFTSTTTMFPTYPTASGHNTYVVKLRDYSFTPTTGVQTRSAQGNATRSIIARTWDGSSVTEETPVVCDLVYAIGRGPQWWIRPAAGTPSAPQWCAVSADRDAPWAYFQSGSSTADTTNPIEINNAGGGGIFAFPKQIIGTTSNSLGTMFSVNASPANSSDWAVRIHQRAVFHLTVHTTWTLPPVNVSTANQYLRVAAHGHTYTDDGVNMNTGLTTINALEYETHSAVRVRTTVEGIKTTEVGRSWLPLFYRAGYTFDGAIDYVRYATHSGVISLVPSSFPADVRFHIERDPNDTPLNSIGDPWMRSISFTLHQASDVY